MTSGRPIDHIVLAVRDLDSAARTYERLGFTLTPRASHEDRMGTSNRLAQFAGRNFIELLEVDRPDRLDPHDFAARPPRFSFGAHNRHCVSEREGISMLVFAGDDARADIAAFERNGVHTYAPFDFERKARLPDGQEVTVGFSLAFATSPAMPDIAFFVCQNRAQEYFWKPDFQVHDNRAEGIVAVYLASPDPDRDGSFLGKMFGGGVSAIDGGVAVACGKAQDILVLQPGAIARQLPGAMPGGGSGPMLVGIALSAKIADARTTSTDDACGMFIEWRPA
jgi:catechol 2,3-dioxygenase-like lactoylglutathione lyase family enzyme